MWWRFSAAWISSWENATDDFNRLMEKAPMTATKKVMIFSAMVAAPPVLATVLWLVLVFWKAEHAAKFQSEFSTLQDGKSKMSTAQVENLLGQPSRIEHAESTGITADAYHYPTYPPGGDLKVVLINGILNHTELHRYQTP
jgi:hypothetical protein